MSSRSAGALLGVVVVAAVVLVVLLLSRGREPVAQPSASLAASPSPSFNEALLSERLTVLVIGLDSSESRRAQGLGANSDTLILASVNADQSEVTLISLPRDTVDIPLSDGTTWTSKVNGIYAAEGVDALVDAVSTLFDVPVGGYVQVDMDDLEALVDAVDGVDVNPAEPLDDTHASINLHLSAGPQTLDGRTALA